MVDNAADSAAQRRAKAYLFDNNISLEQVQKAWDKGIESGNGILKNFAEHGKGPLDLAPHLINDLLHRHGND